MRKIIVNTWLRHSARYALVFADFVNLGYDERYTEVVIGEAVRVPCSPLKQGVDTQEDFRIYGEQQCRLVPAFNSGMPVNAGRMWFES